jgi:hypothetical protein
MPTDPTQRRKLLYSLLGDLPERNRPIAARLVTTEEREGYILEKLILDLNGMEEVPAYFSRPPGKGPFAAVLFNHAHGGKYDIGKEEYIAGRGGFAVKAPYAKALTEWNLAGLCIDTWAFGERRGKAESEIFKEMLWRGQCMWGMMVYDNLRALDYLTSRPDVDPARIATGGLSMGSTMAWWTAALDTRIKACFDICCLTDFDALIETRNLDGHGLYYYVPGLLKHFSAAQINELIAPRAHLSLAGIHDELTPPAGLERIDKHLKNVYADQGAADAWQLVRYGVGHVETADMRERVKEFLRKSLAK